MISPELFPVFFSLASGLAPVILYTLPPLSLPPSPSRCWSFFFFFFYSGLPLECLLISSLPIHSSPLQRITSGPQSPTYNFLLPSSSAPPAALLPGYILHNNNYNNKTTTTTIKRAARKKQNKTAANTWTITTAVTVEGFSLSALHGNNDSKSFLLRHFLKKPLVPQHSALWQAVKCVWTSEQSSTYSTPVQLCANERCVCVCVCVCVVDCCKGLSRWLTHSYAWNNSYTRQVAVAPRSPEPRCHLRNTVWIFSSFFFLAADCRLIALPIVRKTKKNKAK